MNLKIGYHILIINEYQNLLIFNIYHSVEEANTEQHILH